MSFRRLYFNPLMSGERRRETFYSTCKRRLFLFLNRHFFMPENPTESEKVKRHFSSAMTVSKAELTNIFQKIKVHVKYLFFQSKQSLKSFQRYMYVLLLYATEIELLRVCLEKVVSSPALPYKVVNQEINNLLEMKCVEMTAKKVFY